MFRRPALSLLVLPALLICVAGPARAQEDAAAIAAREHFAAAEKLFYENADYDAAVAEYLAAYAAKPHANVLYNIALAYERIYKPAEARLYYERFLREAPQDPGELRQKAEARLKVLRALPGSILVETEGKPGATVKLTSGRIEREGKTPHRFDGLPPGDYHLRVTMTDHKTVDSDVHLAPGDHHMLTLLLEHEMATLVISSKPSGARVFIDGREEGMTPFSRSVETGKRRKLRLEVEDFPPYQEEVSLHGGQSLRRDVVFKRPLRSGRTELMIGSMVYGAFGGVALSEAVGAGNNLPVLLLSGIGGVGVGFLTSWLATKEYVKVGHSSMIIGSAIWGTTMGAGLGLGLDLSSQYLWAATLLGGGLGITTGVLVARLADTSAGDAAIVNSGGTWGSVTGALLAEAISFDTRQQQMLGWMALGGCALGLATAGIIARYVEVSRGHVAIVDVGGVAGLALGFGIGWGAGGSIANGARYGLGAMALGILAAAILARNYKDDLPPTGGLVTQAGGKWSLGIPTLSLGGAPLARETRLNLSLFQGEF